MILKNENDVLFYDDGWNLNYKFYIYYILLLPTELSSLAL